MKRYTFIGQNLYSYKYATETIQIGAVLLDDSFKRIGTLCQYVHPEHGVIDYFIENLTGIKNSQVKNAPKLEEVLLHMIIGWENVITKSMPGVNRIRESAAT